MPRCPQKQPRSKTKAERLRPYIPCFFDVPYKTVQEILGVTHHLLDPIRREMGYDRWPYPDVKSDNFHMTADEITRMRRDTMPVADDHMRHVLVQMQDAALKAKSQWKRFRQRNPKTEQAEKTNQPSPQNKEKRQTQTETLHENELNFEQFAQTPPNEESMAFWNTISQLLAGEEIN